MPGEVAEEELRTVLSLVSGSYISTFSLATRVVGVHTDALGKAERASLLFGVAMGAAGAGALSFAQKAAYAGAGAERIATALERFQGSSSGARAEYDSLADSLAGRRFGGEEVARMDLSLRNMGASAQQSRELVTGMAGAVAANAGSLGDLQSATDAMSVAFERGSISNRQFLALFRAGIPIYDVLQKRFGYTKLALEGMEFRGQRFNEMLQVITEELGRGANDKLARDLNTLGGSTDALRNSWDRAVQDIGRPIGAVLTPVLNEVRLLTDGFHALPDAAKGLAAVGVVAAGLVGVGGFVVKAAQIRSFVVETANLANAQLKANAQATQQGGSEANLGSALRATASATADLTAKTEALAEASQAATASATEQAGAVAVAAPSAAAVIAAAAPAAATAAAAVRSPASSAVVDRFTELGTPSGAAFVGPPRKEMLQQHAALVQAQQDEADAAIFANQRPLQEIVTAASRAMAADEAAADAAIAAARTTPNVVTATRAGVPIDNIDALLQLNRAAAAGVLPPAATATALPAFGNAMPIVSPKVAQPSAAAAIGPSPNPLDYLPGLGRSVSVRPQPTSGTWGAPYGAASDTAAAPGSMGATGGGAVMAGAGRFLSRNGMPIALGATVVGGLLQSAPVPKEMHEGFDVAGAFVGGAGQGAMIGSMIAPGIGTAIGAALLGAIEGGMAFWKDEQEKAAQKDQPKNAQEAMVAELKRANDLHEQELAYQRQAASTLADIRSTGQGITDTGRVPLSYQVRAATRALQ